MLCRVEPSTLACVSAASTSSTSSTSSTAIEPLHSFLEFFKRNCSVSVLDDFIQPFTHPFGDFVSGQPAVLVCIAAREKLSRIKAALAATTTAAAPSETGLALRSLSFFTNDDG